MGVYDKNSTMVLQTGRFKARIRLPAAIERPPKQITQTTSEGIPLQLQGSIKQGLQPLISQLLKERPVRSQVLNRTIEKKSLSRLPDPNTRLIHQGEYLQRNHINQAFSQTFLKQISQRFREDQKIPMERSKLREAAPSHIQLMLQQNPTWLSLVETRTSPSRN